MRKLSIIVVIVIVGILVLSQRPVPANSRKLTIVTSFYPLYFFTSQITGEKATVINLTPAGAEPHDYEPTTGDLVTIQNSRLLILNGAGLEPWADKLTVSKLVVGGSDVRDPHIWLDPVLAQSIATQIRDALIKLDSSNTITYSTNASSLQAKLTSLDSTFRNGLATCQQRTIVTSHAAFAYLAKEYGLTQVAIAGLSPDQEPSPKQLAETVNIVKTNDIKYIFFESLVSPKLAQTLAQETGAKTLVFNPLEGLTPKELSAGQDYFTIQTRNLANLKVALECN